MAGSTLEDLVVGAVVTGINPAGPVSVVTAQWHGTQAVTLVGAALRSAGVPC